MGKCGETQTRHGRNFKIFMGAVKMTDLGIAQTCHGAVVFILIGIIPMTNLDGNELSFC
jgi:hypothetical protein